MNRAWQIFVEIRRILALKLIMLWIKRQKRLGRWKGPWPDKPR